MTQMLKQLSLLHLSILENNEGMGFLKIFFQVLTPVSIIVVVILLYSHASSSEKAEKAIQEAIARIEQKLQERPNFHRQRDQFQRPRNRNYVPRNERFGNEDMKRDAENQLERPEKDSDSNKKN